MKSSWAEVNYWNDERQQKALLRDFSFADFKSALDFVNKVGLLAEAANHHPDINLSWGTVRVWLTTHSAHKITEKDHSLSKAIDVIYQKD